MKKLIFVLLLLPALIACNQEEICEKHEVTIELYDLVTDQVTAYDMELNTEVVIDYSKDVFKMSKMDLYRAQYAHPVMTFLWSNGSYYSL